MEVKGTSRGWSPSSRPEGGGGASLGWNPVLHPEGGGREGRLANVQTDFVYLFSAKLI